MKKGLLILSIPLAIGLVLMGSSGSFSSEKPRLDSYQTFEFTVWADSLQDSTLSNIPVVRVSDREAARASLLVLQNQDSVLPFRQIKQRSYHLLTLGRPLVHFQRYLHRYTPFTQETVGFLSEINLRKLKKHHTIVLALNHTQEKQQVIHTFLQQLRQHATVVVVNFGDYRVLEPFAQFSSIVQAPNNHKATQEVAAQLLFGGVAATRGLPTYIAEAFGLTENYFTEETRLGYAYPEYVGISSDSLAAIDKIVAEGIANFAMPGCQVLIAKGGKVIYHKAFGYHTYDKKKPVKETDLYDLASITKIASTTLAAMKLYEQGELSLNSQLNQYFKDPTFVPNKVKIYDTIPYRTFMATLDTILLDTTISWVPIPDTTRFQDSLFLVGKWVKASQERRISSVFDIRLRDLLTHTSGLQASLPIEPYKRFINSSLFSPVSDEEYRVPVADHFFLRRDYLDSLWNDAKGLRRRDSSRYEYSCVNMILMQRVIDSINQKPIDQFNAETFYQNLGLQTMCFNPREQFELDRLVPTSSDRWRGQLICGTVHDPTAALLGGVSGNAGLFSNANDLAILSQMLMNKGTYGGERYLADSTVEKFTNRQQGHRGFGFDKPPRSSEYLIAQSASLSSFGHTGFTGTCVWVDPENDLVYVFLSNRIHPSVKNYKLNELRIRQRIHQVIYDAMGVPERKIPPRPKRKPVEEEPKIILATVQDSAGVMVGD